MVENLLNLLGNKVNMANILGIKVNKQKLVFSTTFSSKIEHLIVHGWNLLLLILKAWTKPFSNVKTTCGGWVEENFLKESTLMEAQIGSV